MVRDKERGMPGHASAGRRHSVRIDPPSEEARQLWQKVLELAQLLGPNEDWALVGGLMVQLHAYEHAATSRPTDDIDILSDARRKATQRIARILDRLGNLTMPPITDPRLGYQWTVDGHLVELLAPDGLGKDPQNDRKARDNPCRRRHPSTATERVGLGLGSGG